MKRKVIKQGNNTLTITLPRKWTEQVGIKAGDEIELAFEGPTIVMTAHGELPSKSITVALEEREYAPVASHPNMIRTIIGNLYKVGYDQIEISFTEPRLLKEIQERTNLLLGMEIFRSSDKSCILKSILKENPEELDSILRKFFLIVLNYSQELFDCISNKQDLYRENIENFRLSIERLGDFLKRLISKNKSQKFTELNQLHIIIRTFEKTAREYIHLSNYVFDNKLKVSKRTKDLLKEANEMLRIFYENFYKFSLVNSYKQANTKNKLLYTKGYDLLKNSPRKEAPAIHHLLNIVRRVWDMEGPLISLRLH